MSKVTYKEFKEFVNSLSEEQLEQNVVVSILDGDVMENIDFGILAEDMYVYDGDSDDYGTIETIKECHPDDFDEAKLRLVEKKGTVCLTASK